MNSNYICRQENNYVVCESKENYEEPPYLTSLEPPGKVSISNKGQFSCNLINRDGGKRLLVVKDFAGKDINLYLVSWKDGQSELCFDTKEIQTYYPELSNTDKVCITDTNSEKQINLVLDQNGWIIRMIKNICKTTT